MVRQHDSPLLVTVYKTPYNGLSTTEWWKLETLRPFGTGTTAPPRTILPTYLQGISPSNNSKRIVCGWKDPGGYLTKSNDRNETTLIQLCFQPWRKNLLSLRHHQRHLRMLVRIRSSRLKCSADTRSYWNNICHAVYTQLQEKHIQSERDRLCNSQRNSWCRDTVVMKLPINNVLWRNC